jgi:hypothetical protein
MPCGAAWSAWRVCEDPVAHRRRDNSRRSAPQPIHGVHGAEGCGRSEPRRRVRLVIEGEPALEGVLRDKERHGEAQHQIVMGAFPRIVGFVGGFADLDAEVSELFL